VTWTENNGSTTLFFRGNNVGLPQRLTDCSTTSTGTRINKSGSACFPPSYGYSLPGMYRWIHLLRRILDSPKCRFLSARRFSSSPDMDSFHSFSFFSSFITDPHYCTGTSNWTLDHTQSLLLLLVPLLLPYYHHHLPVQTNVQRPIAF
jgi:hypothetical protein